MVAEVMISFRSGRLRQELLDVAEQEIDVEAALVRLVDDDRVVLAQIPVALRLGEQDAVGHQLHVGRGARPVGEAHLVADDLPELGLQLLGDARRRRARRDAPRLGVADHAVDAAPELQADLRQLRGLARAGLAADDHHLVSRIAAAISSRRALTGSSSGNVGCGRLRRRASSSAGERRRAGGRGHSLPAASSRSA